MLAKVQQFPTLTEDFPTENIEVVFDPSAPLGSQFKFSSPSGGAYLVLDEQTTISVTLTGEATFASVPVFWPNPPSNVAPQVTRIDDRSISFQAPEPNHYFVPWIFGLNVNFRDVSNIMSPSFFLVRRPIESAFTLSYHPDGSFSFQRQGGEADMPLAGQKLLVNVLCQPCTIVLTGASFDETTPIVWSHGKPSFIDVSPVVDNSLQLSFPEPVKGQSAGFQFAIRVPDGQGGEITILSPDPIVINATIGDG